MIKFKNNFERKKSHVIKMNLLNVVKLKAENVNIENLFNKNVRIYKNNRNGK